MSVVGRINELGSTFAAGSADPAELQRLRAFLEQMKAAGVARVRSYDLPQPDTIGREVERAAADLQEKRFRAW